MCSLKHEIAEVKVEVTKFCVGWEECKIQNN